MSIKKIDMPNNLGERLRQYRKQRGLTGSDLSKLIGISQGSLSDIETSKTTPSSKTLENLIRNTDIDIVWLLTGEGPKRVEEGTARRELTILDESEEWSLEEIRKNPERKIWLEIQLLDSFEKFKKWKLKRDEKKGGEPGHTIQNIA